MENVNDLQSMQEMVRQLQQRLQVLTTAEQAEATEVLPVQNAAMVGISSTQGQEAVAVGTTMPEYPMPRIGQSQFGKLLGPPPVSRVDYHGRGDGRAWGDEDRGGGDRDPVPKWDGKNPGKTLKPWLRELRIWRVETLP